MFGLNNTWRENNYWKLFCPDKFGIGAFWDKNIAYGI